METPGDIALLVIKQDDIHCGEKIQSIRNLMMCARMTQEGLFRYESEISFYASRKQLNQQLIDSSNETLIILNAITIALQMLYKIDIPSKSDAKAFESYKKTVDEYSHYLKVLSRHSSVSPKSSNSRDCDSDNFRR